MILISGYLISNVLLLKKIVIFVNFNSLFKKDKMAKKYFLNYKKIGNE